MYCFASFGAQAVRLVKHISLRTGHFHRNGHTNLLGEALQLAQCFGVIGLYLIGEGQHVSMCFEGCQLTGLDCKHVARSGLLDKISRLGSDAQHGICADFTGHYRKVADGYLGWICWDNPYQAKYTGVVPTQ